MRDRLQRRERIFGKVATIFCKEGHIRSRVVHDALTTSNGLLKLELSTLVYRGVWLNRSGYRGMSVRTKKNICRGVLECRGDMERTYGAVNG